MVLAISRIASRDTLLAGSPAEPSINRTGTHESRRRLIPLALSIICVAVPFCAAIPSNSLDTPWQSASDPLGIDWDPAPAPEDGPPLSAEAMRDPAYLPAQIAGIVSSYIVALVLVVAGLTALAKTRRKHQKKNEALEANAVELSTFYYPPTYDVLGQRWGAK